MKNLLALLLMALLLVPALAMAAPQESINVVDVLVEAQLSPPPVNASANLRDDFKKHGLFSIQIFDDKSTSNYYPSGALWDYRYTFDECGCEVGFSSDGTRIEDGPIFNLVPSDTGSYIRYIWDEDLGGWIYNGQPTDLPGERKGHVYSDATHTAPVKVKGVDGKRPPLTIVEAVKAQGFTGIDSYDDLKKAVDANTFNTQVYQDSNPKKVLKSNGLGMLGYFYDDDLIEWYAGSVRGQVKSKDLWCVGDSRYGIDTQGKYNWDTGDLELYKFYTADKSMNAAYSTKNVLLSYEMWDKSGAYWCYSDGKWEYAQSGFFFDAVEKDPTTEVLEKILHAPVPATYTSSCVTSTKGFDSEGVPYIIADMEATPVITAKQLESDLRATEFDITLEDKEGQPTKLDAPVTLTLAYPAGMTQGIVNKGDYEIAVVHDNKDVMSTVAGNVTLTSDGPQVTASSFSPYTVVWGTADELRAKFPGSNPSSDASLPRTGDNSQLPLFAGLLAVSAIALAAILLKRRAHQ